MKNNLIIKENDLEDALINLYIELKIEENV
jgi:hypothetical protein